MALEERECTHKQGRTGRKHYEKEGGWKIATQRYERQARVEKEEEESNTMAGEVRGKRKRTEEYQETCGEKKRRKRAYNGRRAVKVGKHTEQSRRCIHDTCDV